MIEKWNRKWSVRRICIDQYWCNFQIVLARLKKKNIYISLSGDFNNLEHLTINIRNKTDMNWFLLFQMFICADKISILFTKNNIDISRIENALKNLSCLNKTTIKYLR